MKSARRAVNKPLVVELSFLARLKRSIAPVWGAVKRFVVSRDLDPLLSAKETPLTKIVFFAMFCWFVRKQYEISKLFQWTAIMIEDKGVENMKQIVKNLIYQFQMIKIGLLWSVSYFKFTYLTIYFRAPYDVSNNLISKTAVSISMRNIL